MDVKDLLLKEDMILKESVIYAIINIIDLKLYIGSAVQARRRKQEHLSKLRNKKHCNVHLQRAFNKHGELNFKFVVLVKVSDVKDLAKYEQVWIDKFDFEKQLYNFCPKAGTTLGRVVTEQTKKKIGNKNRGLKRSPDTIKKLRDSHIGYKPTSETIKKVSEKRKRKVAMLDIHSHNIIKIFNSLIEAKNFLNLRDTTGISSVIRGKTKQCAGYKWALYK